MAFLKGLPKTRHSVHNINLGTVWVQLAVYSGIRRVNMYNVVDALNGKYFEILIDFSLCRLKSLTLQGERFL